MGTSANARLFFSGLISFLGRRTRGTLCPTRVLSTVGSIRIGRIEQVWRALLRVPAHMHRMLADCHRKASSGPWPERWAGGARRGCVALAQSASPAPWQARHSRRVAGQQAGR